MFAERVPWLLVNADLMAENDPRCNEAALGIYHRYLEEKAASGKKDCQTKIGGEMGAKNGVFCPEKC